MAKKKISEPDPAQSTPSTPRKRTTTTKRGTATADTSAPLDISATANDSSVGNGASAPVSTAVTSEQIAEAAYQRYLRRGAEHGRDFDDWVEAERELRSQQ